MKQTVIFLVVILSTLFIFHTIGDDEPLIPKEAIRFRVLADSNSEYDQQIKNEVRDDLQLLLYDTLKNTTSIEEAKNVILNNIDTFDHRIATVLKKKQYQKPYTIDYGYHYFPEKVYKGVTYEAGTYESLLVTLGSGKGDNWWCVLFPPLCLLEAEETAQSEVEYKFFVTEIINSFLNKNH